MILGVSAFKFIREITDEKKSINVCDDGCDIAVCRMQFKKNAGSTAGYKA